MALMNPKEVFMNPKEAFMNPKGAIGAPRLESSPTPHLNLRPPTDVSIIQH